MPKPPNFVPIPPRIFLSTSMRGVQLAHQLYESLQYRLQAEVAIATDLMQPKHTYLAWLRNYLDQAEFAVVVVTAEDIALSSKIESSTSSNLLFEAGLCVGVLGRNRTIILTDSVARLPFGLSGMQVIECIADDPGPGLNRAVETIEQQLKSTELRRDPEAIPFSCFVSHSAQDRDFARTLVDGLNQRKIPCWADYDELLYPSFILPDPDFKIQRHDKLLFVSSKHSATSQWMQQELHFVKRFEVESNRTVIFPLTLDREILTADDVSAEWLRSTRPIIDFSNWKDETAFKESIARLVRALTVTIASEGHEQHA